jgi:beta-phosphoglucomutase
MPVTGRTPLVFDFDGVIADTEPLHWKAWVELLALYGITLTWDDYQRNCQGKVDTSIAEVFQRISNNGALAFSSEQLLRRRARSSELLLASPPICQATCTMLKNLRGSPVGLVTTNERAVVEQALRTAGILDCFSAFVFREDVARHKPFPDAYLLAKERLGAPGIAFEDSAAGLESASRAGFETIRVADPAELASIVNMRLALE